MFRGIIVYLCVYLAFPPTVWLGALEARAQNPAPAAAPQPPPAPAPAPDDRVAVRQAMSRAAWKLAETVKAKIPGMLKIRTAEWYSSLAAFGHCLPSGGGIESLKDVDDKILKPAQEAVAAHLVQHAADLGTRAYPEGYDPNSQPSLEVVVSSENAAQCQPSVWRAETSTLTQEEGVPAWALQAQQEGRVYQEPFLVGVSRFRSGEVTNLEVRAWIGWLASLREFRNLLAKYYNIREAAGPLAVAPEMRVPNYVGRKVTEIFTGFKANEARARAAQIMTGSAVSEQIVGLPKFVPCPAGPGPAPAIGQWCYADGVRQTGVDLEEDVVLGLQAPEQRTHGHELNALRKLGIKALMAELSTVNSLLDKDTVELAPACRAAGDLEGFPEYYDKITSFDQKQYWAQKFAGGVERTEKAYHDGTEQVPLPRNPRFFEAGQTVALEWVEAYFRQIQSRVVPQPAPVATTPPGAAPAPAAPAAPDALEAKKQRLIAELRAVSFADRVLEGARGTNGGDFAALLAEKLRVWYTIVQEEVGVLPEATRRQTITHMIEEVVLLAFQDALEGYVLSVAVDEQLDTVQLSELWKQKYKSNWEIALRSETLTGEVSSMATRIAEQLFRTEGLDAPYDPAGLSDEALTKYVRKVAPRIRDAVRADDTVRYLESVVEWRSDIRNVLPGPQNYHWNVTREIAGPRPTAPPWFLLATLNPAGITIFDAELRGYGYTMDMPDATKPEGYVHIQAMLKSVAERNREALIERLRARGYTDDAVRRQFGTAACRNTGVLADLLLRKFGEVVDANETADRGRTGEVRRQALQPLLRWLQSTAARTRYEAEVQKFSSYLYSRYLKGLMESPTHDARWRAALEDELKRIKENETYLKLASTQEISDAYDRYKRQLEEERASERFNTVKEELRALRAEATQKGIFEGAGQGWRNFCSADRAKCREWFDKATAPLRDETKRRGLYESRFNALTEHYLFEFLKQFGTDGALFDGTVPADGAKAGLLASIREGMLRAWVGWLPKSDGTLEALQAVAGAMVLPAAETVAELVVRAKVVEVLKQVSRAAHDRREDPETLIMGLMPGIRDSHMASLRDAWEKGMRHRLDRVSAAIAGTDVKKLDEVYGDLQLVFGREFTYFLEFSRRLLAQSLFDRTLSRLLIADFAVFREAIATRALLAQAPQPDAMREIGAADVRIRELEDKKWELLQKARGDEAKMAEIRETREFKELDKEIDHLKRMQALAWEKRKAYVELRRLVRNHLGDLPEAKTALAADEEAKRSDDLWAFYATDQFLASKKDGLNKDMALSPAQIVDDLNRIAEGAARKFRVEPTVADGYLKNLDEYCSAGMKPESKPSFERAYVETLAADASSLKKVTAVLSLVLNGFRPTPEMSQVQARLRRVWSLKAAHNTEAEFDRWFAGLPFAVFNDQKLREQITQGLPGVTDFCNAVSGRAMTLRQAVAAIIDRNKAKKIDEPLETMSEAQLAQYWDLVQASSDVLFNPESRFAPVVDGAGKIFWFDAAPSREVPGLAVQLPSIVELERPLSDGAVTGSLVRFASLPGMNGAKWQRILVTVRAPAADKAEDRIAWIRGLTLVERQRAFEAATAYFLTSIRKVPVPVAAAAASVGSMFSLSPLHTVAATAAAVDAAQNPPPEVFELKEAPIPSYEEWSARLRQLFMYWDGIKRELRRQNSSPLAMPGRSEFPELSRAIFRLFVMALPYRLQGNRLALVPDPGSEEPTLDAYDKATPVQQRRWVEDIEELYVADMRRQVQDAITSAAGRAQDLRDLGLEVTLEVPPGVFPFRDQFARTERAPGTTRMFSIDEQRLYFYAANFVPEPVRSLDVTGSLPTLADWRLHYDRRTAAGMRADTTDTQRFEFDLTPPPGGNRQLARFEEWVSGWKSQRGAAERFTQLKSAPKPPPTPVPAPGAREHVWDLFPSLDKVFEAELYSQHKALLTMLDNNSRPAFAPKTYQYALATLNWNIFRYGVEPPVGPTAQQIAPGEFLLAKLLEEVVAVMDIDLRDYAGWQNTLGRWYQQPNGKWAWRGRGQPEDSLLIAQSMRSGLVGAGERRFLATSVEAPYSVNPGTAGTNYTYRPFPVVDGAERSSLTTPLTFEEWLRRTEDPQLFQTYRVTNDDQRNRSLYQNLMGIQNDMIGERDIQAGNPARRDLFSSQQGNWTAPSFDFGGNVRFEPRRVAELRRRLELKGVTTDDTELKQHVLPWREALVAFRRTVSELNLRYEHESWRILQLEGQRSFPWLTVRNTDIPEGIRDALPWGGFTGELKAMCTKFKQQLGYPDEALPNFDAMAPRPGTPERDVAGRRREAIARAIYWASQLANRKVFARATTEPAKQRLRTILATADEYYIEEAQKIEVRRGLKVVATNINTHLKTLCESRSLADIRTDDQFRAAKKLIMEDTKLVFFDNLTQLLYFESGWVQDGATSQTRRLLGEMAHELAASKKLMNDVSTAVNWAVAITMLVLLFGKANPGMARVALGSRIVQGTMMVMGYAAMAGFAAMETYQIYEDFWGKPDEIEILTTIRDTHFTGRNTLMRDETAAAIDPARRAVIRDQRSTLRWIFHVWGIVAGIQALSPLFKVAKGGASMLLRLRNPMRPVNTRFRPHARWLGLGGEGNPYQAVEALTPEEAQARLLEAYRRALGGRLGPNETILLEAEIAQTLRADARKQLEQLCRELELNPDTLLPWGETGAVPSGIPGLTPYQQAGTFWQRMGSRWQNFQEYMRLTPEEAAGNFWQRMGHRWNRLFGESGAWNPSVMKQQQLAAARDQSRARLEYLQALIRRLGGQNPSVTAHDIVSLVGVEADPIYRHTPFLMSLMGIPNLGPQVRTLRTLRAIAQADLDVMALHDPQMLHLLAYFNSLSVRPTPIEKWELFSHARGRGLTSLPGDVRRFFRSLQADARELAEDVVRRAGAQYQLADEKELARLWFFRDTFADVMRGMPTDPRRAELVERYVRALVEGVGKNYTPQAMGHYFQMYLRELGLAPEIPAAIRLNSVHAIANWRARAGDVVREYARRQGVTEDEVIYWMIRRDHPNYRNFTRPAGAPAETGTPGMGATDSEGFLGVSDMPAGYDINHAAHELRQIMTRYNWAVDMDLARAIARSDYRAFAHRLVRIRRMTGGTRRIPPGEPGEGTEVPRVEGDEFDPLAPGDVVEPRRPAAPDVAERPVPQSMDELRAQVRKTLDDAVKKLGDDAEAAARLAGKTEPADLAAAREAAEAPARARVAAYLRELEGRMALIKDVRPGTPVWNTRARHVLNIAEFNARELVVPPGARPSPEAIVTERMDGLLGEARAELDATIRTVGDEAVAEARARGVVDERDLADIRERAEAFARRRADEYLANLRRRIDACRVERPQGYALEGKVTEIRGQLDLAVENMNGLYRRELSDGRLLTQLETEMELIELQKGVGVIHNWNEMMRLINTANKIPAEDKKAVIDCLLKRGSTEHLQRALGFMRRTGRVLKEFEGIFPAGEFTPDMARKMRLAIAYSRAMHLAENLPTWAEKQTLLNWFIESYLKKVDTVVADQLSVAEARQILGLPRHSAFANAEIEAAAARIKGQGADAALVDRAVLCLQKVYVTADTADLETLALMLDMPVEYLPSQAVAQALTQGRTFFGRVPVSTSAVEGAFLRRYGPHFEETVDDALRLAAMDGRALDVPSTGAADVIEAARARAAANEREALTRLRLVRERSIAAAERAQVAADPAAEALHRECARRAERAEWLVSHRGETGVRWRVERPRTVTEPETIELDVTFRTDPVFGRYALQEDTEIVRRVLADGFFPTRSDIILSMAKGSRRYLARVPTRERITRLMHIVMILNDLKASGRNLSEAALSKFEELLVETYMRGNYKHWIEGESETFFLEAWKRSGATGEPRLSDPETLERLNAILNNEERLIKAEQEAVRLGHTVAPENKPHLSPELCDAMKDALWDVILRRMPPEPGALRRLGPDSMARQGRLQVPEEVLIALARAIEKNPTLARDLESILMHVTHGHKSQFRTSDAGNFYGDVHLWLFGPPGRMAPQSIDAFQRSVIRRQLQARLVRRAVKSRDAAQIEALEEALRRVGGSGGGEGDVLDPLFRDILDTLFPEPRRRWETPDARPQPR